MRLPSFRSDGDQRLQLGEDLFADALDLHQVLDALEIAVALPVIQDALGHLGPDLRQFFQLAGVGGVDVDQFVGRPRPPVFRLRCRETVETAAIARMTSRVKSFLVFVMLTS